MLQKQTQYAMNLNKNKNVKMMQIIANMCYLNLLKEEKRNKKLTIEKIPYSIYLDRTGFALDDLDKNVCLRK